MERKVILALDGLDLDACTNLLRQLGNRVFGCKIHDLWDRHGPSVVSRVTITHNSPKLWVDLKLIDIPNTVGLRAKAVREAGANILTIMACGEIEMMMAAVKYGPEMVLGVTELTSLTEEQVHLHSGQPRKASVLQLARNAKLAGLHGLVCSTNEVGMLAKRPELKGMILVVPGVRSPGKDVQDQKQVDTPANTIRAGADYLVIGREVTQATDPLAALDNIERQIEEALADTQA